jgi:hypothetical protein
MRKQAAFLFASAAITLVAACSCVTYLSAGQLGEDSIVPPPILPSEGRGDQTELLAAVSQANGYFYQDDYNRMAQAGILRAWRRQEGDLNFDGHFAASGWYGQAKLNQHSSDQYIPSVANPFSFYGGTVQAEEGIADAAIKNFSLEPALRCSVAYEDGAYRAFRAEAAELSSNAEDSVIDRSASGWSGTAGLDLSATFGTTRNVVLRLGLLEALLFPDLETAFSNSGNSLRDYQTQGSIAIETDGLCFSAALNYTILNYGVAVSLGYILP